MSLSIGELVGYVDLDTTGVKRGVSSTRAQMRSLGGDMAGTTSRMSTGLGSMLGGAIKGLGIGMVGLGVAGGAMGLKTAAGLEQADIAFTTMLGSASKADAFLRQLGDFAAKTPFEFPELQSAASSLISAGIEADKVIPIMTTLGDVTSGMGTGSKGVQRATVALQQMAAAGRITGEDLNQLRDAGIPVYDLLAKATNKSKAEVVALAQAGKLGSKELGQMMKALETGKGLERFSGLMEKQSASLGGMWSTFTDTLNMQLAKAITPMIPLIKDGLGGASESLAKVLPTVAAALMAVVTATVAAIGFMNDHKTLMTVLAGVVGVLTAATLAHGAALAVSAAGGMVAWLKGTKVITMATKVWAAVQWALNAAMTANPIGLIVVGVVALVAAFVIAYKKSEKFRAVVRGALDAVKKAAQALAGFIMKWTLPGLFIKHWDTIKTKTMDAITKVVGFVKAIPGKFKSALSTLRAVLSSVFSVAMNGALDKVRGIGNTIRDWIAAIPGRLASLGGKFANAGRGLLQQFIDGMRNAAGIITGIAGNVWDTVRGLLNGAIDRINSALVFTIDLPGPKNLSVNLPDIPHLATGGRATRDTLAVIGDGREPESVLPDSMLRGLLERAHAAGKASASQQGGRNAPLIGTVIQGSGESADVLAERLWFKTRTRG